MPDDTPDLVRRLEVSARFHRKAGLEPAATNMEEAAARIRAQAAEIAALQVRDVKIAQDLDEIFTATFGNVGSEPNVYADYDNCTQLQGKMRRAIQLLRPIAPAPDAEGVVAQPTLGKPCACKADLIGISDGSSVYAWRCTKCSHEWPKHATTRGHYAARFPAPDAEGG